MIYFSHFLSNLKKVIKVNFKDVVQILYRNKSSRKRFPILLDMTANYSNGLVKTIIHQLKITDLGDHLSQIIFIFNSIKVPACELHLGYPAMPFAAWA